MSSYPVNPPPSYGGTQSTKSNNSEEVEPLLFHSPGAGPSHGNAVYDMPDDVPDDFKVKQGQHITTRDSLLNITPSMASVSLTASCKSDTVSADTLTPQHGASGANGT